MKLFESILCLGLACGVAAQAQVHIREVGLSGYVAQGRPNRVSLEVSNPSPAAQTFTLRLSPQGTSLSITPHTDYKVQLTGGETRVVEVAFYVAESGKLLAQQLDASEGVISHSEKESSSGDSGLVAVVCAAKEVCRAVAQAIRAGNTIEEQNAREQKLKIILLQDPPETWFAYTPAAAVVVAASIAKPTARAAIADYARLGGKVIVAEDQASREFLADYRVPGQGETGIGKGTLTFVSRAAGSEMEQAFSQESPKEPAILLRRYLPYQGFTSGWLMSWVGTRFEFPRLSWLLGWMTLYVVVIGIVNFMVLRKIGKVELAWVTVPVVALLFGTLFYFLSVRGKMRQFALDEVSFCWMDDRSPRGALSHSVRVSSPQVRDISLQAPVSSVLSSVDYNPLFRASDVADVWSERGPARPEQVPDVIIDSAQNIQMEMLRLSFRDLGFESLQDFPGTMSFSNGRLANATGQNFSQAVLIDFARQEFYELGPMPAGAEITPFTAGAQKKKMSPDDRRQWGTPTQPFSLPEFIRVANFPSLNRYNYLLFVGLTEQSMLRTQLEGITPNRRVHTLFLVKVWRPE